MMSVPLKQLGHLSLEAFFAQYWQKKPVCLPQALPGFRSPLTPDELAGLALEDDVESRLVTHNEGAPWQLRRGPFSEADFTRLHGSTWTLLVQAVDMWVPAVAKLLDQFRFIPHWRLDDIMVSYAPTGGSVGPHFDYYDVFLLQGAGRRRWQLGGHCDSQTPRLNNTRLNILRDFREQQCFDLEPGDMLYIPPGIAHWGTSLDDECMTYSIGFRAPSHAQMLTGIAGDIARNLSEDQRFRDQLPGPVTDPGHIDMSTLAELQRQVEAYFSTEHIALWFGRYTTEPKYPDLLETDPTFDHHDLDKLYQQQVSLAPAPGVRLCYTVNAKGRKESLLFAAGREYPCPTPTARLLCENSNYTLEQLYRTGERNQIQALITQLCRRGVLGILDELAL